MSRPHVAKSGVRPLNIRMTARGVFQGSLRNIWIDSADCPLTSES